MIRKIIDYVKEDAFELHVDEHYICVVNYTEIRFMEEEKISVRYPHGSVFIKGNHLVVVKLLDSEMLIRGDFTTIEFRREYE